MNVQTTGLVLRTTLKPNSLRIGRCNKKANLQRSVRCAYGRETFLHKLRARPVMSHAQAVGAAFQKVLRACGVFVVGVLVSCLFCNSTAFPHVLVFVCSGSARARFFREPKNTLC